MNLWIRLIWLLASARRRARLSVPGEASSLAFRVWPHDLDPSLHMNNGRYFGIMDLGRLDVIIRSGLWRAAVRHGWTPIANAAVIRFRRELRPFDRYRLETRILAWDDLAVVMEQVFLFEGGDREGQVAARALFKGGLYDRSQRQFVPIARLMAEIGARAESPTPSAEVAAFLKTDEEIKRAGAERG
jgi:acyl-CoA thioesterase FadM